LNTPRSRRARALIATAVVVVSSALALAGVEAVMRLTIDPGDFLEATLVDDDHLGHRIKPGSAGHDAQGFRNVAVPQRADIVAIGDSMTYGVGAPRDGSWPAQLARSAGVSVHNMGLGGYGPLQYLHLAREVAPSMKPKRVVVAFYFGNDLMDAYYAAHGNPRWHSWRLSAGLPAGKTDLDKASEAVPKKRFGALRNWLARNSLVYGVLRATVFARLAARERQQLAAQSAPDQRWPWRDPAADGVTTVFTPGLRLATLDLALPSVREGMEISKRAFRELKDAADRQGSDFWVVLIPTKERAYCRYLDATQAPVPDSFSKLCEAEDRTKAELVQALEALELRHVDVTAALETAVARHEQLYPADFDGHPQSAGYGVIAREVAKALKLLPAGR
jgi:lysophospholipase L1-like esterase